MADLGESLRAAGYSASDERLHVLVSCLIAAEFSSLEDLQFASRCPACSCVSPASCLVRGARLSEAPEFAGVDEEDIDFLESLGGCSNSGKAPSSSVRL